MAKRKISEENRKKLRAGIKRTDLEGLRFIGYKIERDEFLGIKFKNHLPSSELYVKNIRLNKQITKDVNYVKFEKQNIYFDDDTNFSIEIKPKYQYYDDIVESERTTKTKICDSFKEAVKQLREKQESIKERYKTLNKRFKNTEEKDNFKIRGWKIIVRSYNTYNHSSYEIEK